jgi:hypothetical protein
MLSPLFQQPESYVNLLAKVSLPPLCRRKDQSVPCRSYEIYQESFADSFLSSADVELIAKIEDELNHEKASGLEGLEDATQNVKLLLDDGPWQV